MCRHIAYLGPPRSLAALLVEHDKALLRQSWAPCDMRGGGTVNADGFGVGWYGPDGEPVRYRRSVPMWTDANFAALAPAITTSAMLAAVRSATVGMPIIETACAPFTWGRWLFSHNGKVTGWPESLARPASTLPATDLMTLDAPTDSAVLWAVLRHRIAAGAAPADALADLVTEVAGAAPGSRLNLMLTDGETVLATAWDHSLSVLVSGDEVVVASEPWDDDPRWQPVPDRQLVIADRHGVRIHDLIGDTDRLELIDKATTSTEGTSP